MPINTKSFSITIICGGPSLERGISLNSARSVMDHISSDKILVNVLYVNQNLEFYQISSSGLYSNTPSDFDFKLSNNNKPLNKEQVLQILQQSDITFPLIHGEYGEDGQIQEILEANNIAYIGNSSKTCNSMFNKIKASNILCQNNYVTLSAIVIHKNQDNKLDIVTKFFSQNKLSRVIIKPSAGGSSIGIFSANTPEEASAKLKLLFDMQICDDAIVEEFCYGKEFTIIILENKKGEPTSLIPSEIEICYKNGGIFDYRRKYLPTSNTKWKCPPSFSEDKCAEIREKAEKLFTKFEMRDFARIDGWVKSDGKILFTDFNPISGMEQNSFIFQQSSRIGLTHSDLLHYIIKNACRRYNIPFPEITAKTKPEKNVFVLFGGNTAERQVSIMSGTNVWLKLLQSNYFSPSPYLLDINGNIWQLPYSYALSHTAEEIYENCSNASIFNKNLEQMQKEICSRLEINISDHSLIPKKYSLEEFLSKAKKEKAFIFLGLHGGDGENGNLQAILDKYSIKYNGSGAETSAICMDKYNTGELVKEIGSENITTAKKYLINIQRHHKYSIEEINALYADITKKLGNIEYIIKPRCDGCSSGIVKITSNQDLIKYFNIINENKDHIPINTFKDQNSIVEISPHNISDLLLEEYIETDRIIIEKNKVQHTKYLGWVELTVGILESKGIYHSLTPSITIASGSVLSVEEKFQGGTGINITPPPEEIISNSQIQDIRLSIEAIAMHMKIENYARIDIFFNTNTNKIIVIEVNNLPALTPSTVLYHQGLAEMNPVAPRQFLENIVIHAMNKD